MRLPEKDDHASRQPRKSQISYSQLQLTELGLISENRRRLRTNEDLKFGLALTSKGCLVEAQPHSLHWYGITNPVREAGTSLSIDIEQMATFS
jgi:hypothetical protein